MIGSGANDGFMILLGFAVRGEFSINNGIDEVTKNSIGELRKIGW